jgi:hypothetical protein
MVSTICGPNLCCNSKSNGKTRPSHRLATHLVTETEHKGGTKTKKNQGNNANKGACKEPGTEKKVPTWGTRSKVDLKNPEAKIPNVDLSSKTNPWVEFEKNFKRAAFGLQESSKIDHAEDRCNHKVRKICEIHC